MPREIVLKDPKKLILNPINPRLIRDVEYENLKKSLTDTPELFDARPVIVSTRTGQDIVLAGNMRVRASIDIGKAVVPTIEFDDLTPEKEEEMIIKDNGRFGDWDMDMLANDWAHLPLKDWGVDLPDDWLNPPDPGDGDGGGGGTDDIEENFNILIECKTEQEQAELLERFVEEGITCRALIS